MKKVIAIVAAISAFALAAPKCNFDKAIRNYEKRLELDMSGSKVTKEISKDADGVSVIRKLSKPIKSGQFMGLRQFLVYGFVGCELKDVRTGKVDGNMDVVKEATVHLRKDGNLKASCDGSGDVVMVNPMASSLFAGNVEVIPNRKCICYDEHSIERTPSKKTWCAETEDLDPKRLVIPSKYLDFVNPFEKKVDNSGSSVQVVERDCYFNGESGGRTVKKVLSVVAKNLKKLSKAVDSVEGDEKDGNVTLKIAIAPDGSVSSARVVSATLSSSEVKNVVSETVSGWNFGKSGNDDAVFFLVLKVGK